MLTWEQSVTTFCPCASSKTAPSAASRSRFGVVPRRLPRNPTASARSVSIVTSTMSGGGPENALGFPPPQDRAAAARTSAPSRRKADPGERERLPARAARADPALIRNRSFTTLSARREPRDRLRQGPPSARPLGIPGAADSPGASLDGFQELLDGVRVLPVRIDLHVLLEVGLRLAELLRGRLLVLGGAAELVAGEPAVVVRLGEIPLHVDRLREVLLGVGREVLVVADDPDVQEHRRVGELVRRDLLDGSLRLREVALLHLKLGDHHPARRVPRLVRRDHLRILHRLVVVLREIFGQFEIV